MKPLSTLDEIAPPLYPPLGVLDYAGAELVMEAMTDFNRDTGSPLPPERAYRLNACRKEPWTVAWIESISVPSVLYDVGANVGSYSLVAAARGISVVAIEPSNPNIAALKRNVLRNDLAPFVTSLQLALGDHEGLIWLNYGDMRSGAANHELGDIRNPNLQREIVPLIRLDALIPYFTLPAPTHLKIDVDGAEREVLLGCERTLCGEALQTLMIEMRLDLEAEITTWLAERNWMLTQRFDERDGRKIADICYGQFGRASAKQMPSVVTGTQSQAAVTWYGANPSSDSHVETPPVSMVDAATENL